MKKLLLTLVVLLLIIMSLSAQVTDKDGNNYRTVKIGTQEWMAENLNVSHFRNGDTIIEAKTNEEWKKAGEEGKPVWCYYEYDPNIGTRYGKLYNWYAVTDPRGLSPKGWHLPTDTDWKKLTDFLGGEEIAGGKMKSTGTTYWRSPNNDATNSSGFTGLPGGTCSPSGVFGPIGDDAMGNWWSSTEDGVLYAWSRYLSYSHGAIIRYHGNKKNGLYVRCIKD